ncbi:Flavin mononucleotide phosphatase YbjI [Corynebacterium ciconiae DSM 44920]|uniref:Cof-type HAD-IIB family hydrolase n=1 Tax=Corynebacterium ciconiae TaxID=227319 RepID=UPI00035D0CCF|nr:Cof-type HAD-IIB family hydrolase [Corynebacterium ciconiae]WKD61631.1 Flavin mononucleotide phosphatase YbjI [Corynebacterium ciconiae DSM 44920]
MFSPSDIPATLLRDHSIKLVVADMDGTLLGDDHQIPAGLWPLLSRLDRAGITFAPASGRQYATLYEQFNDPAAQVAPRCFIAENGTNVVCDDTTVSTTMIAPDIVREVVGKVGRLAARGHDVGLVVCTPEVAYIDRTDPAFLDQTERYYASMRRVDSVAELSPDNVIKIAIFGFDSVEETIYPHLANFTGVAKVAVSGAHWIDVMSLEADKGHGLRHLCSQLGISPEQTLAFGDYLNDCELLQQAGVAVAMANAHPRIAELADYIAPPNSDQGVLTVLTRLLDGCDYVSS